MVTALIVIAILVLLIVAHEFGHFIAAKLFGIRVEEFGIGYPPRAFSFGKWGETEYTLNWIPFGGFVRLFGDEGDGQRGKGSYIDAPRFKQAIVLVAGVSMNVLIAWVLFTGAYTIGILHIVDALNVPGAHLMVTDVVAGSPADAAGIQSGDDIVAVSDPSGTQATLTPDGILSFVSARGGQDISFTTMRTHATTTAIVRPAHAVVPGDSGRPAVGIGLALVTAESVPWGEAMRDAAISTYNTFGIVVSGLWTIIVGTLHGAPNLQNVTGPVGLMSVVGQAARNGFGYVLSLAAFISVNLAVINLIPIPALDGGRLVVVGVEALMRRRAPRLAIQLLNTIGIALIIILMITVTYHDIAKLLM
jgi:regulator of sigma E protease